MRAQLQLQQVPSLKVISGFTRQENVLASLRDLTLVSDSSRTRAHLRGRNWRIQRLTDFP